MMITKIYDMTTDGSGMFQTLPHVASPVVR